MRISRVVLYLTDKPTHSGQTEQQRQLTSDCLSLPTMPQLPGGEADPGTACASHNSLPERGVPCKISKHIKKNREENSLNTFYITKKRLKCERHEMLVASDGDDAEPVTATHLYTARHVAGWL